jgi:hypothetical protein
MYFAAETKWQFWLAVAAQNLHLDLDIIKKTD